MAAARPTPEELDAVARLWNESQILRHLGLRIRFEPGGPPLGLVIAELWGGLDGLAGGYGRSVRRIQRIREAFPS